MVGYVVHFLELALIPDRPHEGDALPVLEEVANRLFDLAGVLTAVLPIAGIVEAILKILRRTDFSPPFVLDLEREIANGAVANEKIIEYSHLGDKPFDFVFTRETMKSDVQ